MEIRLTANGREYHVDVEPRTLLVDCIRDDLRLTGTHIGCEEGKCGACTIHLDGRPVKSCMVLAVQADGAEIGTVEGLADGEALHPLQQAFHDNHGLQCGFCTPGILMAAKALLASTAAPTEADVREYLVGNICRCTGYNNIVKAVLAAAGAATGAEPARPGGAPPASARPESIGAGAAEGRTA